MFNIKIGEAYIYIFYHSSGVLNIEKILDRNKEESSIHTKNQKLKYRVIQKPLYILCLDRYYYTLCNNTETYATVGHNFNVATLHVQTQRPSHHYTAKHFLKHSWCNLSSRGSNPQFQLFILTWYTPDCINPQAKKSCKKGASSVQLSTKSPGRSRGAARDRILYILHGIW